MYKRTVCVNLLNVCIHACMCMYSYTSLFVCMNIRMFWKCGAAGQWSISVHRWGRKGKSEVAESCRAGKIPLQQGGRVSLQNIFSCILGIVQFINTTIIYFRILYPLRDFPATAKVRVTGVIIHTYIYCLITAVLILQPLFPLGTHVVYPEDKLLGVNPHDHVIHNVLQYLRIRLITFNLLPRLIIIIIIITIIIYRVKSCIPFASLT
jgi:hypothetical protein